MSKLHTSDSEKINSQNLFCFISGFQVTKCHNIPVSIGGDPAQQDPKRSLSGEAQTTATNGNNLSVGHVSGEGRKQAAIGSILGDGAGDCERAKPSRRRGPK
jgi:hypothetical protein